MDIVLPAIEEYIAQYSTAPDALLQKIITHTKATHPKAHMLSGAVQGIFLQMISSMLKPARVLEIGTFTGFSAICLAKGLPPEGLLHTIELREADAAIAQQYFNESIYSNKIILHVGNAKDIIPLLSETWDLIFIDADKLSYIYYYELTLPLLKSGGYMLVDNVLFYGDVLGKPITGKNAVAIHAFNEHLANDDRTEQVMLSVRDGITVIKKL